MSQSTPKNILLTLSEHQYISVDLDGQGGGTLTSNLNEAEPVWEEWDQEDGDGFAEECNSVEAFNTCIDGMESLVLAHACAGVDITTPAYLEGLLTAYQTIGNQHS